MRDPLFLVFDVESIGLHGEGFAVGWIVIRGDTGQELSQGILATDPRFCIGGQQEYLWVVDHVPIRVRELKNARNAWDVREMFWAVWHDWKAQGALLAADVPWPVEANFLSACIRDGHGARHSEGPYPVIDVASVRLGAGFDPLAIEPRIGPLEEPEHDPQADARQSARLLVEALRRHSV
jgi:hypothetical protein